MSLELAIVLEVSTVDGVLTSGLIQPTRDAVFDHSKGVFF
jgi:hypothetical protein